MNELKGVGMVDKTICRVQKWCLAKKQGVINWGQGAIISVYV